MEGVSCVLLVLAILFSLLVPAHVGADDPVVRMVTDVVIKDANNKRVGTIVGQSVVALRVNGINFFFGVSRMGLAGNVGSLVYESTDCTGPPFMDISQEGLDAAMTPRMFIGEPGMTVYMSPDASPVTVPINVKSWRIGSSPCAAVGPFNTTGVVPEPMFNLADVFTPPFRVKFKIAP